MYLQNHSQITQLSYFLITDWANREYVQLMSGSITRIADFLNAFSKSCSGRLSYLDARLTALERKVTFLEAKVCIEHPPSLMGHPRRISDESEEEESCLDSQRIA